MVKLDKKTVAAVANAHVKMWEKEQQEKAERVIKEKLNWLLGQREHHNQHIANLQKAIVKAQDEIAKVDARIGKLQAGDLTAMNADKDDGPWPVPASWYRAADLRFENEMSRMFSRRV